eukprot:Gregarina_sp_Pseudo_9__5753@NODE_846_length_2138_cov_23_896617_g794_i0_p1_GENE_NODE_846_length_2138_cov_23_896617_g794_i0NODE_846_length_2138_cov_23_896617_g794_i0_p1_ORF_typecomplete_len653_score140_92Pyr_redox_2/PF07992_14/1_3e46Pyr_redox/PF00070_27/5_1e03Pyr_redox/PF00070_27/3_4e14HI0933_like/PF03486_14/5_8e02HI0933_like/PF03486_14/1_3HI0933_like/PF03486_14/0_13Thi4/PF01946_17/0_0065Pyr_redox_3/PF13738_6/0_99Pyr_redox_3/PF13738_6/0_46GIDA/PF01134_22/3_2e02GIDA/PF01134_22/0_11Lycopene_cycl/PF0
MYRISENVANFGRIRSIWTMNRTAILFQSSRSLHSFWGSRKPNTNVFIEASPQVLCEERSGTVAVRRSVCNVTGGSERVLHGACLPFADPNKPLGQTLQRFRKNMRAVPYRFGRKLPDGREELVVLGTGWASLYFLSQIDPTRYKITVVSPRPYFVFTPLLTAALGGVQSVRSIMEPIRSKMQLGRRSAMEFVQGTAEDIDVKKREVQCELLGGRKVKIPFERLVIAVGSETNTFGIPGVEKYCSFLKEIEDVREIRLRLFSCFEKAAQPGVSDADKKRLLSFVIVGGGPAGVEAAAEMNDMIKEDLRKQFPGLLKHVKVSIIEMLPKLLPMFDETISKYTSQEFEKTGIERHMECKVTKIDDQMIHISTKSGEAQSIPYSFCLWASGVGQVQLSKKLMSKIPDQKGNRVMRVRPTLEVIGGDKVYALGDCAWVTPPSLAANAEKLYQEAKKSVFGPSPHWLKAHRQELMREGGYVQLHPSQCAEEKVSNHISLVFDEFKKLLEEIDKSYHPPVPTAQMARQAGAYLGTVLNQRAAKHRHPVAPLPWAPRTYGAMSYVGNSKAIVELTRQWNSPKPRIFRFMGSKANLLWRSYYWTSQTSKYNRIISLMDYTKKSVRGRDLVEQSMTSTAERNLRGTGEAAPGANTAKKDKK